MRPENKSKFLEVSDCRCAEGFMITPDAGGQDRLEILTSCLDWQCYVAEQRTLHCIILRQHAAWVMNTTMPLQHQVLRHRCKLMVANHFRCRASLARTSLANTHAEGELLPMIVCCCPTWRSLWSCRLRDCS